MVVWTLVPLTISINRVHLKGKRVKFTIFYDNAVHAGVAWVKLFSITSSIPGPLGWTSSLKVKPSHQVPHQTAGRRQDEGSVQQELQGHEKNLTVVT